MKQRWLGSDYPAIELRAKTGGRDWGDETAAVNTDVRGRSYAPTDKIRVTDSLRGGRHTPEAVDDRHHHPQDKTR